MHRLMAQIFVVSLVACSVRGQTEDARPSAIDRVERDRLRLTHESLGQMPHDAGTEGDRRVIKLLAGWFEEAGLEVEVQELELMLPRPVDAEVLALPEGKDPIQLVLREKPLEEDPFTADKSARPGWNAWSGSGTVEGELVYVNYGRLEDFERLKELGVSLDGRIAIARYGGNYRGYKAKYAEQFGASGLLIFTDPADSGYRRGLPYPQGGYANETHIQRGSLKTLPYYGDPFTPGYAAVPGAERAEPQDAGLPTIPVQPMGWAAAEELLSRMRGPEAPDDWQGGLPHRYRLTSNGGVQARVRVTQAVEPTPTANVLGTIRGANRPDEYLIVGCHHDAWGFGAGDPLAGLMTVVEAARVLGALAKEGWRPDRTIVFAGWAAEEHGIIGSVEYLESRLEQLQQGAVAYINLDMAAMGPDFTPSASPSLARVLLDAASAVPSVRDPSKSVAQEFADRTGRDELAVGILGGGSDHVGFLCHACIPSASISARGSRGTAYHSLYDTIPWYQAVVGDDYASAQMVTRLTLHALITLADGGPSPSEPFAYAATVTDTLDRRRDAIAAQLGVDDTDRVFAEIASAADEFHGVVKTMELDARTVIQIERAWCGAPFDDGRPWYRNGFVSPDATSGYAAWVLPGVEAALMKGDADRLRGQLRAIRTWFRVSASIAMGFYPE